MKFEKSNNGRKLRLADGGTTGSQYGILKFGGITESKTQSPATATEITKARENSNQ